MCRWVDFSISKCETINELSHDLEARYFVQ